MSSNSVDSDVILKVVLIGDYGVGKTSLSVRFARETFSETPVSTIGVDFFARTIPIPYQQGTTVSVRLQLWDTAGQEKFRSHNKSVFRGAAAIVYVYDVTQPSSFERLEEWMSEASDAVACDSVETINVIVGNKSDMIESRGVATERGETFARAHRAVFFETSAKEGTNVDRCFTQLTAMALKQMNWQPPVAASSSAPPGQAPEVQTKTATQNEDYSVASPSENERRTPTARRTLPGQGIKLDDQQQQHMSAQQHQASKSVAAKKKPCAC
eukprot:PhM_4_TR9267/c0_g1_i1/m.28437/K07874/RAB1A; Ras-related protein Rab-1A